MNTENLKKTLRDLFPMMPDFTNVATTWADRAEKTQAELAGWEQKAHDHVTSQMDEAVKLTKDSMTWGLELSSAWRKNTLELVQRGTTAFAPKA
jgi:hypothetical protein